MESISTWRVNRDRRNDQHVSDTLDFLSFLFICIIVRIHRARANSLLIVFTTTQRFHRTSTSSSSSSRCSRCMDDVVAIIWMRWIHCRSAAGCLLLMNALFCTVWWCTSIPHAAFTRDWKLSDKQLYTASSESERLCVERFLSDYEQQCKIKLIPKGKNGPTKFIGRSSTAMNASDKRRIDLNNTLASSGGHEDYGAEFNLCPCVPGALCKQKSVMHLTSFEENNNNFVRSSDTSFLSAGDWSVSKVSSSIKHILGIENS